MELRREVLDKTNEAEERPRIGIPLPTFHDQEYNHRSWQEYADAVQQAGGDPVRIALDVRARDLSEYARTCVGFVLPGSPADVDPLRYGEHRHYETAAADQHRESCDYTLLSHAEMTGKPVLAICYGLQIMNAWRGGTLVQDLQPVLVNHAAGRHVATAHAVVVAGRSLLGGLLTTSEAPDEGQFRRLPVNSSHHQAVAVPGEDLAIVARSAQDMVIEALEGRVGRSAMLGVQWHPERSVQMSPASRALFTWLVSEAADVAARLLDTDATTL